MNFFVNIEFCNFFVADYCFTIRITAAGSSFIVNSVKPGMDFVSILVPTRSPRFFIIHFVVSMDLNCVAILSASTLSISTITFIITSLTSDNIEKFNKVVNYYS